MRDLERMRAELQFLDHRALAPDAKDCASDGICHLITT